MITRKRDLHNVNCLEPAFFFGRGDERGLSGTDSEDAGLRGVDDSREVGDVEHAEVGDGEGATLFKQTQFFLKKMRRCILIREGRGRGESRRRTWYS